jgi:hypothetical protein
LSSKGVMVLTYFDKKAADIYQQEYGNAIQKITVKMSKDSVNFDNREAMSEKLLEIQNAIASFLED